ncbi:MAG: bacillithiol biosynthesis BshC, partial [Planctomycetes bacterium]|nr:bacillithiol biosynthesis BshC [Planctomycetota bacterium]
KALRAYALSLGAPAAAEAARRLEDPDAVVVAAGQQPGVGGGPLLSFAKAAGTVALARRLEAAGAGPVVPVWWVASEDHDLDEAGAVLLGGGRRGSDLLAAEPRDRRMLSAVAAPPLAAAAGDAGGSEFSCEVLLHREAAAGASLGAQSARWFMDLLSGRGLVVLEPQVVRPFARGLLAREIGEPGLLAAAVREGNAAVRRAGYEAVLADPAGPLHFTVDGSGRRTRGGGTAAHLEALATGISADAALRVLVQDAALPVAAQVGGPTEIEYLAALLPARRAAGVFVPCAVPRPGLTILEKRVEEALAEFRCDLASLYLRGEEALRHPGGAGEDPLAVEARRLRAELTALAGDPAAHASAVRSRLDRARHALEDLAAAAARAAEERRGVGESRRRRVLEALLPEGVPQERRWSLLAFLLRHGRGLADRLADALEGPEPGHRVVRA